MILPLVLAVALLAAFVSPEPGTYLSAIGISPWLVVIIFVVNGYQTDLRQRPRGRELGVATGLLAAINLLAGPVIGYLIVQHFGLSGGFALGLILMACMPPTLSSGIVLTALAGGDALWALIFTVALNILGVFVIPLTLPQAAALSGDIALSPWPLFLKLVYLVMIPFLCGQVVQRLVDLNKAMKVIKHVPTACVGLAVWIIMSQTITDFGGTIDVEPVAFIAVAFGGFCVHAVLLMLCAIGAKILRLPPKAVSAFVFTGSQKTLPVAISILVTLPVPAGLAVLACLAFHFIQLFFDGWIAGVWKKRAG